MDFFLKLFNPEKTAKKPDLVPPAELEKSKPDFEVKSELLDTIPDLYFSESSPILDQELSYPEQSIKSRIESLEALENLAKNSFFLKLDENSSQFSLGLDHVQLLSSALDDNFSVIKELKESQKNLQVRLAENYLKIGVLINRSKNSALALKEFQDFERVAKRVMSINESLEKREYLKGLKLCEEGLAEDEKISRFSIFADLKKDLERKRRMILEDMNKGLAEIFSNFHGELFEEVVTGFLSILEAEKLCDVIKGIITDKVSKVISDSFTKILPNLPKSSLKYMIKITPVNSFMSLISEVLKNFSVILKNFYSAVKWLKKKNKLIKNSNPITGTDYEHSNTSFGSFKTILKKLKRLKERLWRKIENNLSSFLEESSQICQLKHGEIRLFISWISNFLSFSQKFSKNPPDSVHWVLEQKTKKYLSNFNTANWLKITTLLEVETWTQLPIPKTFNISTELSKYLKDSPEPPSSIDPSSFSMSPQKPFETLPINPRVSLQENPPVFCTAGVNLLKILGSYLELLGIFSSPFEVFHSLSQILDFFLYEIFVLFSINENSSKLYTEIPQKNESIKKLDFYYEIFLFQNKHRAVQINMIRVQDIIESLSGETEAAIRQLHNKPLPPSSLTKAVIAIESYRNIVEALRCSQDYLKSKTCESEFQIIENFINNHSSLIEELSDFIIGPLLKRNFEIDWLTEFIRSSRWEFKTELESGFVVKLLKYFEEFSGYIKSSDLLPVASQNWVLEKLIYICFDKILEGISLVKYCTVEGRSQMKKDLRKICRKLKRITRFNKPKELFEYISIWTRPSDQILEWVQENIEIRFAYQVRLLESAPSTNTLTPSSYLSQLKSFYNDQMFT